tara:strand:+ start:353 stop:1327 length:975 start_codon:yes stop_codon:yes gene_type:complete
MSSSPRFQRWSFRQNKRPDRSNGDQYYYITDFNQVTDKDCINYDKANEKIYMDNLKLFNDINKKLRKSIIQVTEKPKPPPRPNNYERLFLWRQRNIKLSVEDQTIAILYLLSKNINIRLPNSNEGNENSIEPWEAINRSEIISNELREDKHLEALTYLREIKHLAFTKNLNERLNKKYNNVDNVGNNQDDENNKKDNNENQVCKETSCNDLICNNPEHHNVKEKINHFSRNTTPNVYPNLNDLELPMNMNVNFNVDNSSIPNSSIPNNSIPNNSIPNRRNTIYLPDTNYNHYMHNLPINLPNNIAPSAPPNIESTTLPPDYKSY